MFFSPNHIRQMLQIHIVDTRAFTIIYINMTVISF